MDTQLGARSGVWLMRHRTLPVTKNGDSYPGGSEGQAPLGWSASREHERVVRRRSTPNRQTFRMDRKG
jgi:hypothetical protein